jgi:hypothetical protein
MALTTNIRRLERLAGVCIIKLFTTVICGFLYKARVFVPGKPLQPRLMFVGNARAYLSEAPFRCFTLGALPTNIRLGWKGLPGTSTLAYYENP